MPGQGEAEAEGKGGLCPEGRRHLDPTGDGWCRKPDPSHAEDLEKNPASGYPAIPARPESGFQTIAENMAHGFAGVTTLRGVMATAP
jgi:hypothetical protein